MLKEYRGTQSDTLARERADLFSFGKFQRIRGTRFVDDFAVDASLSSPVESYISEAPTSFFEVSAFGGVSKGIPVPWIRHTPLELIIVED